MNQRRTDPPKFRRWPWRLGMVAVSVVLFVGPWPVDDAAFSGSAYQARTLDRLDRAPGRPPSGPIRVGVAEVDLTPNSPRPLAGFIGQVRTPYVGVDSPCLARALTVASGSESVTILTADLLLINAKLARATCDRAGVGLDRVYFTSSHTHGGPGGWGDHPLEMLTAGAYDPAWFDELAGRLADVVRRSRTTLEPAEMGFVQVQTKGRQSNRVERGGPTHDALSALIFRPIGSSDGAKPIAIFTVFGAHATVSHPIPPRLGGDYPAALVADLKKATGARSVLFAAGAVGDASPGRPGAASQAESAAILGSNLADDLKAALGSARFERRVDLANLRIPVDLPPVRLPLATRWLRFSPLATWWIADRQTHLHAVRIGPAALVGFPGDYSGHLADRLVETTRPTGLATVATSFDGDYRGYLVSSRIFREISCYETRWMSFYGPHLGEYLNDIGRRMVARVTDGAGQPGPVTPNDRDWISRIALGLLLTLGIFAKWRSMVDLAFRVGWVSLTVVVMVSLAFVIDPDLVDWGRIGCPLWLRLAGLALGIYAGLILRTRPTRSALSLALAFALLSANGVIVLMLVRGWLRSGLIDRSKAARSARTRGEAGSSLRKTTGGKD